ncbi:MAG: TrkA C-terminal domain-containing protein, partial [Halobacteriaceae archaeon]
GPAERDRSSPVTSVADLPGDADVVELRIDEGAPIVGKTLQEAVEAELIDSEMLAITIERDNRTITPHGGTTIQSGDLITVISKAGLSDETIQAVNSQERG